MLEASLSMGRESRPRISVMCPYKICPLPESNKKYLVQLAYLFFSFIFLIRSSDEFTFFSLALFTAPILIDLFSSEIRGKLFLFLRYVFIFINVVVFAFCICGLFEFLEDNQDRFSVTAKALLFSGFSIQKVWFACVILCDLLIPVMLYFASPTKVTQRVTANAHAGNGGGSR